MLQIISVTIMQVFEYIFSNDKNLQSYAMSKP